MELMPNKTSMRPHQREMVAPLLFLSFPYQIFTIFFSFLKLLRFYIPFFFLGKLNICQSKQFVGLYWGIIVLFVGFLFSFMIF